MVDGQDGEIDEFSSEWASDADSCNFDLFELSERSGTE